MSSEQIWSWIVTIVGVTGFFLAGRKIWWAWYVNIGCQVLWVIFAFVTGFYAFLAGVACYTVVFVRNAYAWTKEHREEERNKELLMKANGSTLSVYGPGQKKPDVSWMIRGEPKKPDSRD